MIVMIVITRILIIIMIIVVIIITLVIVIVSIVTFVIPIVAIVTAPACLAGHGEPQGGERRVQGARNEIMY